MPSSHDAHAITLITVRGKMFVAGLYWQTLHHAVSFVDEAKTIGRENGMSAFVVRKTRLVIQAGYAPTGPESLRGTRSLAAALAHALGDNWIGVFAIGAQAYALVALLDGGVMPGRDMVGSFDDVQAMLHDTIALIDASNGEKSFKRLIAPAEFGVGNDTLTLEALLRGANVRAAARLKPVVFAFPEKKVLIRIAAGVLALTAAVGALVIGYKRHAAQEAIRLEAIERARKEAAGAQVAEIPIGYRAPWELSAAATDTAKSCDEGMNLPLSVVGWILTDAVCAAGEIRAMYARRESTPLAIFRADAKRLLGSDIEASENGNKATIAVMPKKPSVDVTAPMNDFDATVAFTSYFQERAVQTQLTELASPALPELPNAPYTIPWKIYGFTIQSDLSPSTLLDGLHLGGLRIGTIAMTLNDGPQPTLSWSIAGELYVLR